MMKKTMPRHILFATDFTARCDRALDRAVQLAVQWNARLTVVHAVEQNAIAVDGGGIEIPALIAWEVCRLREELSTVDGLIAEVVIRLGAPEDVVNKILATDPVSIIVAGISRNDSLGRTILGTTTGALIKTSGIPVLVVKRRPIDAGGQTVFATDLSENSANTLKLAAGFISSPSVLFHTFDPPFATLAEDKKSYVAGYRAELLAQCRRFLGTTLGEEVAAKVHIVMEVGEPASALATYVSANDVDLVITGTRTKSGVMSVLLGSVATRILYEVPCDILVLPASET